MQGAPALPAPAGSSSRSHGRAAETEALEAGKLHLLSTGEWFVHCRWCATETRLEAENEEEAFAMLEEWRLSMPRKKYTQRNWSCPKCVENYWNKLDQQRSDTARSAALDTAGSSGQLADAADAATTPFDTPALEVAALKTEIVELKAQVDRLKAEVVELKYEEKSVREIAASVMRAMATETEKYAESLSVYPVDVPGACVPEFLIQQIGEKMQQDSIRLSNLSSKLHQLLRQLGWDACTSSDSLKTTLEATSAEHA